MSEKKSGGVGAIATAAVAAVVGAAAVIFSDKSKREKAKKELGKILDEGEHTVTKIGQEIRKMKDSYVPGDKKPIIKKKNTKK